MAYNGSVDFYQVSDEPIADTIGKIYPGLIKDISEMPEDLAKHIRYPNTLFAIQANIYQRYHMDDVNVFYQNEDKWSIATEIYGQEEKQMEPNYYIMKLPGEESEEFISSIPFTPNSKKNMTGLLIARSDGDKYGELVLYRLPKDRVVYGPMRSNPKSIRIRKYPRNSLSGTLPVPNIREATCLSSRSTIRFST